MTDKVRTTLYDEDVITIGSAQLRKAELPAPETGERSGAKAPKESFAGAVKMAEQQLDESDPAPTARLFTLAVAAVGLVLIVGYVLNYWKIIQLPF